MRTAVDTNIILDVLIPGEPFGKSSKKFFDHHLSKCIMGSGFKFEN